MLSEIASLSVTPKLHRVSTDVNVSIDVASVESSDEVRESKHVQRIDDFSSSRRDVLNFLEEWDEPFQSGAAINVSLESFDPFDSS
jgi:hypothetical protein